MIAGTITALALTACGDGVKAQVQDTDVKNQERGQHVKVDVETPELTLKEEAPEVLRYIDNKGSFSFQLCRDAGYHNKGCLKFKREYSQMLIAAENTKQEEGYEIIREDFKVMTESLDDSFDDLFAADLAETQAEIAEIQAEIAETQAEIAEIDDRIAADKAEIAETQAEIAASLKRSSELLANKSK